MILVAYLLALLASHLVQWNRSARHHPTAGNPGKSSATIPAMNDAGPVPGQTSQLAYIEWNPANPSDRPPVILLHGSPGDASNFAYMGPPLASAGYRTLAVDLPGFGQSSQSVPSYSVLADARAILALMDALGIERAHIVGWSLSGGVVLHMADLQPQRIASMTMLAAIGVQEEEGSGSYVFEHIKYGVGYPLMVVLPELIPHFGLLGDHAMRRAFIRSFWDTDQRPLRQIMARLTVPTLILHGRDDFLVPDRAAEEHHRLIRTSRLVMFDASHFMPFLQPEATADELVAFMARHDEPGVEPLTDTLDLAPRAAMPALRQMMDRIGSNVRQVPWWGLILLIALIATFMEDLAIVLAGVLVAAVQLDFAVAMMGLLLGGVLEAKGLWAIGRIWGTDAAGIPVLGRFVPVVSVTDWQRRLDAIPVRTGLGDRFLRGRCEESFHAAGILGVVPIRFILASAFSLIAKSTIGLIVVGIISGFVLAPLTQWLGIVGLIAGVFVVLWLLRSVLLVLTWTGRQRLKACAGRAIHHEYWPPWIFYAPLVPWLAYLSIRHGGPTVFTCCNPGIGEGGGVVGESKFEIDRALEDARRWVLPVVLIDEAGNPRERAERALSAIRARPDLGGLPVILKPDSAQRGFSVRLARTDNDVREYFQTMTRPTIIQKYHPGPHECGILWARLPGTIVRTAADDEPMGRIFSITHKEFPTITGNGKHTLEQLIYRHRRYRRQADVFLARFADERTRVLDAGESLRLAESGNHCQGTLFADGADLVTPELEQRIDEIARSFHAPGMDQPGGFDYGRFDVRYESAIKLRRGEGFAVIELNGATSESTNLYDPSKSVFWAWSVLLRQWQLLYRIGSARYRTGRKPLTTRQLIGLIRAYYKDRPGSAIAD